LPESEDATSTLPDGWHAIEVNIHRYYKLSETPPQGDRLVWLVSDAYSQRFRDGEDLDDIHPTDAFEGEDGRMLEFLGISLRVLPRNALRYRSS
jgi:hypothetical protein